MLLVFKQLINYLTFESKLIVIESEIIDKPIINFFSIKFSFSIININNVILTKKQKNTINLFDFIFH